MEKRTCYRCKLEKPLEDFAKDKREVGERGYACKKCAYQYKEKSRKKAWAICFAYLAEYKTTHPCEVCGEPDPVVLDLHHRDPSEKDDVIRRVIERTCSLERLKAEIAKCQVLCANDHRRLHHRLRQAALPDPTLDRGECGN